MEDPAHGMKETKFGKKRKRKRARYVERARERGAGCIITRKLVERGLREEENTHVAAICLQKG